MGRIASRGSIDPLCPLTMSSCELRKIAAFIWFKALYDFMRTGEQESRDYEESGYVQEESLIARAVYRITCKIARNPEGFLVELPVAKITKTMKKWTERLLRDIKLNGKGYLELTYKFGFSNRPKVFLGDSWVGLPKFVGLYTLTYKWIGCEVDFKSVEHILRNPSLLHDCMFTVELFLFNWEASAAITAMVRFYHVEISNQQCGSKNTPLAITRKSELTVKSRDKCIMARSFSKDKFTTEWLKNSSFNLKTSSAVVESKRLFIENFLHSSQGDFKLKTLQTYRSGELTVEKGCRKMEVSEKFRKYLPGSYLALTPPETPNSKDSRSPSSSQENKVSQRSENSYPNDGNLISSAIRQILTDLPAKDEAISEQGSPLPTKASSYELTPPDSPEQSPSSSPTLEPFDVRGFKDCYSNNGPPLLASRTQFSSALKHFGSRVFLPGPALPMENLCKSNNYEPKSLANPCAIDSRKTLKGYSAMDDDMRSVENFEHGLTGRPEGKPKLFSTWKQSSAFDDGCQSGFQANENLYLKTAEHLLGTQLFGLVR